MEFLESDKVEKVIDALFPLVNLKIITHTHTHIPEWRQTEEKNYIETQLWTDHVISIINSILDLRASIFVPLKIEGDRPKQRNQ